MPGQFTHAQTPFGFNLIRQIIARGSPATITFANIPQSFTTLKVFIQGRDTATGSTDLGVALKMNGDSTSGNYTSRQNTGGTGTTTATNTSAPSAAGAEIAAIPGTSTNASAFGWAEITIQMYASPIFQKSAFSTGADYFGSSVSNYNKAFVWKSSAPITMLTFTAGGSGFFDSSTFTLYGLM